MDVLFRATDLQRLKGLEPSKRPARCAYAATLVAIASFTVVVGVILPGFTTSDGGRTASYGLCCPARPTNAEPWPFLHPRPSSVTIIHAPNLDSLVNVPPSAGCNWPSRCDRCTGTASVAAVQSFWANDNFGCPAAHAGAAFSLWRGLSLGAVGPFLRLYRVPRDMIAGSPPARIVHAHFAGPRSTVVRWFQQTGTPGTASPLP